MSEGTEVTVTQDAGSVAAESTTVPETGAESSASSSAAGASPTGRTYRDEDVQRIVRERLAAERRAHEKKFGEVQSKLTQYEGHYQKLAEAEYARARALGYVQDEQPKYLTEKDVDSRFEKLRGEWIVREMVSHYEKRLAARQNQVATTKEATLKSAPVKGGGGTRSASAAESGGPLRKQIMAQLKSSRGG
jgi:Skp family chaperone for outer membrane proteins